MRSLERDPQISRFEERLSELGVCGVLFDLDDTLIYTSDIFLQRMREYVEVVAQSGEIVAETFYADLSRVNDEEYLTMGVSPKRWESVVRKLTEIYPHRADVIQTSLEVLKQIYTTTPKMRPGAVALLDALKGMSVGVGLVTHANEEWTHRKMNMLGLWRYFDQVYIADENGHKSAEDWQAAMRGMGFSEEAYLVVGDNLKGDIIPADALGARTIWMPSPWSVYRTGSLPHNTVQVNGLEEVYEAVEKMKTI